MHHWVSLLIALPLLFAPSLLAAETPVTFESHVRPILKAYCLECHGEGEKLKGGIDLRLARFIQKGGDSGSALVPGDATKSLLYQKVEAGEMPPSKKKLTKEQLDIVKRWIAGGARVERPEPEKIDNGFVLSAVDRVWWSFQPITKPQVPDMGKERAPIDAFLLQKLREKKLDFSAEADRKTLIRRVTFDLIGLPPTPEEIEAFVKDQSPNAYEKVIDRLLASPHHGERWGRHWLDVAGYADSEGVTPDDPTRPHAWKYRDYVIRAFNADMPYDRFVREQLAGDEMVKPPYNALKGEDLDKLIATGFLRMAPDGSAAGGADVKLARNQVVADTLHIVSTAFLGLSVQCAQCHNHRYDPIPQTDYFRLRAIFEPALDINAWRVPTARRVSLYTEDDRRKAAEIEAEAVKVDQERLKKQDGFIEAVLQKELAKLPDDLRDKVRRARTTADAKRTAEQKKLLMDHPSVNVSPGSLYLYDSRAAAELKKLADQAAELRAKKPVEDFVRALTEVPGKVPVTRLFHRGDPDQPKQEITPGGLVVLDQQLPLTFSAKDPKLTTSGRRLAFARWLTDGKHPLTARVIVNRVWMHHFGRGLVATPGEFGHLGEKPTHPELLDWLAADFMANGWSLKKLHRQIVTSTAYRQSSRRSSEQETVDPDNRLLGRMSVRRLEAEVVRDALLAVSGNLSLKAYGPAVPVRENEVGQIVVGKGTKDVARGSVAEIPLPPGEINRRSVYVEVKRTMRVGVLETFDAASIEPNCDARNSSTVTTQALLLLNNDFVLKQADALAARLVKEAGSDAKAQVTRAWKLAFGTEPTGKQLASSLAFLSDQTAQFKKAKATPEQPSPEQRALASLCQVLVSSNGFLYVD